jgi:hypothetical protein
MRLHQLLLAACLLPVGCAAIPSGPPAPSIAVGELGSNQDSDTAAITQASYTFADAGRLNNNPVGVARAAASVEYLAGALHSNPRFVDVSPLIGLQMQQARSELRSTLGIAPGANPQLVVNGLLGAADAIAANNAQAATVALNPAIFTLGPQRTIDLLDRLPFQPEANVATSRLNSDFLNGGGGNRNCYSCG